MCVAGGILAGECCMLFFFLAANPRENWNSLTASPIGSCGGYEVAPFVKGRYHL